MNKGSAMSLRVNFAITFIFMSLALLSPLGRSVAQARDLQGRPGFGFNDEFGESGDGGTIPSLSVKYGLTKDLAIEGIVGFATNSPHKSDVAAKFYKNLLYETNLNFYYMLGGGAVSENNNSGAQFISGFGVEFFIPGIESLGFAMEAGGALDNLSGSFALRTLGVSFLNAGMHFYF
jgi:hypothetical protein